MSTPVASIPRAFEVRGDRVFFINEHRVDVFVVKDGGLRPLFRLVLRFEVKQSKVRYLNILVDLPENAVMILNTNQERSVLYAHRVDLASGKIKFASLKMEIQITKMKELGGGLLAVTDGLSRWEFYKVVWEAEARFRRVGTLENCAPHSSSFFLDIFCCEKWIILFSLVADGFTFALKNLPVNPTAYFDSSGEGEVKLGCNMFDSRHLFSLKQPFRFYQHIQAHRGWVFGCQRGVVALMHVQTKSTKTIRCHEPAALVVAEENQLVVFGSRSYSFVTLNDNGTALEGEPMSDFGGDLKEKEIVLAVRGGIGQRLVGLTTEGVFEMVNRKVTRLLSFQPMIKKISNF